MGYCWDKERGKWRSSINLNGKYIFLGRFDNELDAKEVYENYKSKLLI
jgi:hypothetical protein